MSTENERKRPSRWQASVKRVVGWFTVRPWVFKWAVRAGRFALFCWSIWNKLKDDLWPFYDHAGGSHAA